MYIVLFIALSIALYFLSRSNIVKLSGYLHRKTRGQNSKFMIISVFLLPGTALHEISHFLAATALMMRVHEVVIFPKWDGNQIKLGRVLYEKKGTFRGILVGIAPLIVGLWFFWFLAAFHIFPSKNILFDLLFGYLSIVVSTTMFSSKQDLIDIVYLIPLAIFLFGIVYVININGFAIKYISLMYISLNYFFLKVDINLAIAFFMHALVNIFFIIYNKHRYE